MSIKSVAIQYPSLVTAAHAAYIAQLYAVQVQVKTVFNTYRRDQLDSHRLSHPVLL